MKVIFIFMVAILAVTVVFGSHFLIFFSLVKFLQLTGPTKTGLAIGLSCLSVSFIIASVLVHYFDNQFTKVVYYLTGLWLGWLTYLFISLLFVWLAVFFMQALGWKLDVKGMAVSLLILSLIVALYGYWNATQIRIKNLTVAIRNLPPNWQNKKLVQISDVHLGSVLGMEFIGKLVERINQQSPSAVVITGDYFDGMDGILDNLVAPLNRLEALYGVYFVTGNHENYLGLAKALKAFDSSKVIVLSDEAVDLDGLSLVGVSYPPEGTKKSVLAVIKKLQSVKPAVLLYHAPAQVEEIAQCEVDLMLAGHTHNGQLWPLGYIARLIFGRYYTGLSRINDFTLYTSVGAGTWGPAMRVGSQPEIVVIQLVAK